MLQLKKEVVIDINQEKDYLQDDPDEEEIDDVNLEYERECHWRIVIEDNYGGADDKKEFLHARRWDVQVNEN